MPASVAHRVPGTYSGAWRPPPLRKLPTPPGRIGTAWQFGDATIVRTRDEHGWTLTIARRDNLPSWDEIKAARYLCVPDGVTMALVLPPSARYVDIPGQPYSMHLMEVLDPRHMPP